MERLDVSGLGEGFDAEVSSVSTIHDGPMAGALIAAGDFLASGETRLGRIAVLRP